MPKNKKRIVPARPSGFTAAQLRGMAVSAVVTGALLAAAAWLIASGRLPEEFAGAAAGICAFAGAASGGFAAAAGLGGRRMLAGCATGFILSLLCLAGSAFGGGNLICLAPLAPGGALGGAAAALRGTGRRREAR
ncbi:MAG: hypothetical protein LBD49_00955 [Oscillospiraceae bacterium]|jgi:putative membrane protein (TIGR04086 family)|nr:hypothetical protein [Oscillospiraceae bacterium]